MEVTEEAVGGGIREHGQVIGPHGCPRKSGGDQRVAVPSVPVGLSTRLHSVMNCGMSNQLCSIRTIFCCITHVLCGLSDRHEIDTVIRDAGHLLRSADAIFHICYQR